MIIEHNSEYFNKKLPYPFEHEGLGTWGITKSELVLMTPQEYFDTIVSEVGTHTQEDVVPNDDELTKILIESASKMRFEENPYLYDIPYILIDTSGENLSSQDGRHRMAAMLEMAVKEVPVLMFYKTNYKKKTVGDNMKVKLRDAKTMYYGTKISENMSLSNEGFLVCLNVPMARTGMQEYYGHELGLQDEDKKNETYYLFRTPDEVFDPISMASWETATLTNDHPKGIDVNPETYKDLTVGVIRNARRSTERDEYGNEMLLVDIIVKEKQAIEDVQNGKREVSGGYTVALDWLDEAKKQLKQTHIRGNHVALVGAGRAGSAAIKDADKKDLIEEITSDDLIEVINNSEIKGGDIMAEHKFHVKDDKGKVKNTYVVDGIASKKEAKEVVIKFIKENQKKEE